MQSSPSKVKAGESSPRRRSVAARCRSRRTLFVCLAAAMTLGACYKGGELNDKQPPAGEIGGACLEGLCNAGQCLSGLICYEPSDPCLGVYCGGNGTCFQDLDNSNAPVCICDPGFQNTEFAYFCLPG